MVNFDGLPIPPEKEHLRKELEKVDESWSVARFDSLPHVVHILTSKDRESEVKILKEQSNVIEDVVDEVVHAYHGGFNKAIQNYSQILRLFSESTQSVDVLKGDLGEAKRSLGARNMQLHQLWYRSVTLRHIIALLDQIEGIAKVPARIEKLIADKQFYAAVQVHAQSTLMLEREGLQTVGALQDVRSELTKLRGILFYKVLEDLHAHLYNKGEYSSSAMSGIDDSTDPLPTTMAITISMSSSQSRSRRTRSVKGDNHVGPYGLGNGLHQPGSIDGGSSFDGHDEDGALVDHDGTTTNGKNVKVASRQIPYWLSESTPDEFIEAMRKNDAPVHVKYLQTMVECLCMLGKVAAAGAMICQRLRPTIHEIITVKIKSHAERLNSLSPEIGQGAQTSTTSILYLKGHRRHKHQNGISSARTQLAVSPVSPVMAPAGAAQAAANELLDSILDIVVRIFENHVTVGKLLESKVAQQVNLNTPKAMVGGDSSWNHDSDTLHDTGGYSIGFSLTVLQSECQQLICEVLRATPEAASADASVQTARLANKTSAKPTKDKRRGGDDDVNFVFRLMDATISVPDEDLGADAVRQGRNMKGPNVSQEGYGTATVLPEQGMYLAASVYRPVHQFTDKVASLLPQNYPRHGNDVLLSFVENFVKDHFLPTMFVDYRKGVQQAISSPAAFRPRAHVAGAYSSSVDKGRPVLQGLLAIDFLAKEVLGWAQAMPKFAVDLVTYVQTFLERAYERCRTSYMEAVLEKQSYMVIGRHDIEKLMRLDTSSASLPQSRDQINHDYSISDTETMETETEISDLLLNLRPIKPENLIRDDNKLILLASLSDSLEYVADSIERLGKTCVKVSIADLPDRTNSAPPKDLATFAEEYRKLAIDCLKVLRVEMQLETIFHMQEIANREYLEDQDAEEPDDYIISLTSQITHRDEEMSPFIAGSKRKYIFGGICSVAANAFFKALSDMESINLFGVQQICRNSIALEQALAAIPFVDGEAIQLRLDRVRTYYELLNMPFEALLAFITEHGHLFTAAEYTSLLNIQVPGRDIPQNARDRVAEVLSY